MWKSILKWSRLSVIDLSLEITLPMFWFSYQKWRSTNEQYYMYFVLRTHINGSVTPLYAVTNWEATEKQFCFLCSYTNNLLKIIVRQTVRWFYQYFHHVDNYMYKLNPLYTPTKLVKYCQMPFIHRKSEDMPPHPPPPKKIVNFRLCISF